jgi:hypothetical protein
MTMPATADAATALILFGRGAAFAQSSRLGNGSDGHGRYFK